MLPISLKNPTYMTINVNMVFKTKSGDVVKE